MAVAEQAGLSLIWSQTPKTDFLVTRLVCISFQTKEVKDYQHQEKQLQSLESEVHKLRGSNEAAEKASNRITELEEELRRLRIELEREKEEKQDVISEKELMKEIYEQVCG